MNNYTIKKVLPRLIIGAILVNSSFIICQVLVDVSNVLGGTIVDIFNKVSVSGGEAGPWQNGAWWGGAAVVGATVLASGAVALLAISGPVIVAVFLSVAVTLLILIGRQAAVILLTVISPLAFLAYTLPNTEQFFKKWIKTFWALLVVFPLVALLFGAGNLAYRVLMIGSNGDTGMQIAALGAAAIPLLAVVPLLRKSLDSLGAVGATLKGWGSRADKRIGEKSSSTSLFGAYRQQRQRLKDIRSNQIVGGTYRGRGGILNLRNWASRANRFINASRISGQAGTNVAAHAANVAAKLQLENVEAQSALIKSANLPPDSLLAIAKGEKVKGSGIDSRDANARAAAMKHLADIGEYERFNEGWDSVRSIESNSARRVIADAIASSDGKPTYIGQGALAQMRNGKDMALTAQANVDQAITNNSYSSQVIAGASREELAVVADRVNALSTGGNAAEQAGATRTAGNAATALSDPRLSVLIGKNTQQVNAISKSNVAPRGQTGLPL